MKEETNDMAPIVGSTQKVEDDGSPPVALVSCSSGELPLGVPRLVEGVSTCSEISAITTPMSTVNYSSLLSSIADVTDEEDSPLEAKAEVTTQRESMNSPQDDAQSSMERPQQKTTLAPPTTASDIKLKEDWEAKAMERSSTNTNQHISDTNTKTADDTTIAMKPDISATSENANENLKVAANTKTLENQGAASFQSVASGHPEDNPSPNPMIIDDIQPMPSPSQQQSDPALPGAYCLGPGGEQRPPTEDSLVRSPASSPDPEENATHSTSVPDQMIGEELAVASLVDETSVTDLSVAFAEEEMMNFQEEAMARKKRASKTKQLKINILLGVLFFMVVATVSVVIIVVPGTNDGGSSETAPAEIEFPRTTSSEAPTLSLEDSILSLLPEESTSKIFLDDPDSPQARAFDWLLEDAENLPSLSPERIQQKWALAVFFYSTNGPGWTSKGGWLNHSIHECDWYNRQDFAMRDIYSAVLPSYLPAGYLQTPPAIRCDYRTGLYYHLWLDNNNLRGVIPEEFYLLKSLKTTSLTANRLGGTLSTRIGHLSNLEGIYVNQLGLSGTIPSEVGLLPRMRFFASNLGGSIPSELWQLSDLDTIIASRNKEIRGSIPTQVGSLKNLRQIWMGGGTSVTGSIPTEIGLATSLVFLALDGAKLTGSIPTELSHLSNLAIITLLENQLTGTIPPELGNLLSLVLLSLRDNLLTGSVPSQLGLLTHLTTSLNLRNNTLTGQIPSEVGLLASLRELDLISNMLTGKIPSQVGRLQSMGHLNFASNSLSGTIPRELAAIRESLHTLRLEDNPLLSGTLPVGVCSLEGTCVGSLLDDCEPPFGFIFDCSSLLCGCGCACPNK